MLPDPARYDVPSLALFSQVGALVEVGAAAVEDEVVEDEDEDEVVVDVDVDEDDESDGEDETRRPVQT